MTKRTATIVIIVSVVIIAVVFFLMYLFLFKPSAPGTVPSGNETPVFPSSGNGGTNAPTPGNNNVTPPPPTTGTAAPVPRLREISNAPTAGATFFDRSAGPGNTAAATVIRYVDRATGNIFETTTLTPDVTRISNKTIPIVYEADWTLSGNGVVLRRIVDGTDNIETFSANITTSTTSAAAALSGVFLPQNITQVAVSPDQTKIFYLYPTGNGSVGVVANPDGSKKVLVFQSPQSEWLANWTSSKTITITSKPSGTFEGFAYALNSVTGALDEITSRYGLTDLASPDGKSLLYSASSDVQNPVSFGVLSVDSGTKSILNETTLPEKCVWSKDNVTVYCGVPIAFPPGIYPDAWYQGTVSFNDNIWKIDTSTGIATLIASPPALVGHSMDIIEPTLDSHEQYLMFVNKKDLTLWDLRLQP